MKSLPSPNSALPKKPAGNIDFSLRKENLSWGAHKEIAALPKPEREAALARAESEAWTVREARAEVRVLRRLTFDPIAPDPSVACGLFVTA